MSSGGLRSARHSATHTLPSPRSESSATHHPRWRVVNRRGAGGGGAEGRKGRTAAAEKGKEGESDAAKQLLDGPLDHRRSARNATAPQNVEQQTLTIFFEEVARKKNSQDEFGKGRKQILIARERGEEESGQCDWRVGGREERGKVRGEKNVTPLPPE